MIWPYIKRLSCLVLVILCMVGAFSSNSALIASESSGTSTVQGIIVNGCTFVPINAIAQTFGYKITWDQKTLSADINTKQPTVFAADSLYCEVNGKAQILSMPTFIYNGSLYVPLRVISEAMGTVLSWNNTNKQAVLEMNNKAIKVPTIVMSESGMENILQLVVYKLLSDPKMLTGVENALEEEPRGNIIWGLWFHGYAVADGKLFLVCERQGVNIVSQSETEVLTIEKGKWIYHFCEGGNDYGSIDIFPKAQNHSIASTVVPVKNVYIIYNPTSHKAQFDTEGIMAKKITEQQRRYEESEKNRANEGQTLNDDYSMVMDTDIGYYDGELKNGLPDGYGVYKRTVNHGLLGELKETGTWTGIWCADTQTFVGNITLLDQYGSVVVFDGTQDFKHRTFLGTVTTSSMVLKGLMDQYNNTFEGTITCSGYTQSVRTWMLYNMYWMITFDFSN